MESRREEQNEDNGVFSGYYVHIHFQHKFKNLFWRINFEILSNQAWKVWIYEFIRLL